MIVVSLLTMNYGKTTQKRGIGLKRQREWCILMRIITARECQQSRLHLVNCQPTI